MVSTKRKASSKEEKQKNERKRLCITSRKKNLHSPEIIPGRVREELLNEASTIKGVINLTVFSKELIDIILPAMNDNKTIKYNEKLRRAIEKRENPTKVIHLIEEQSDVSKKVS